MTRIVAGSARGRRLAVPARGTRPTSDKAREALFSALQNDDVVDGGLVLDLYAGSGALGLEAASRGAQYVVFVEHHRAAAAVCRSNLATVEAAGEVVVDRVERFLAKPATRQFDLVLADPPYDIADTALAATIRALTTGWLAPKAVVVVERGVRNTAPQWPETWRPRNARRYGDSVLYLADTP